MGQRAMPQRWQGHHTEQPTSLTLYSCHITSGLPVCNLLRERELNFHLVYLCYVALRFSSQICILLSTESALQVLGDVWGFSMRLGLPFSPSWMARCSLRPFERGHKDSWKFLMVITHLSTECLQ